MQITFDCPKCLTIARTDVDSGSANVSCSSCGWSRPIERTAFEGETPTQCLVCGCDDLWRQKDFDQRLGVLIVGAGVLLSTIAVAYMMPGVAMLILMAFGLADWVLYAILPDRLVCYRCHSRYRHVPGTRDTAVFDLEVNEKYRQEAIRLKQANRLTNR